MLECPDPNYRRYLTEVLMEFALIAAHPAQASAGAILIASTTEGLTPAGLALDAASEGRLSAILANAGFEGKPGQMLPVFGLPGLESRQLIVVGAGPNGRTRQPGLPESGNRRLQGAQQQDPQRHQLSGRITGSGPDADAGACGHHPRHTGGRLPF
jgi:hypothetical protein